MPVPVRKIVSGGQTGVDRAALDVALDVNIPCGGWCPQGRLAEDGVIPAQYPLRETPSSDYAERTAWNVRDSDGTLILTWGPPTEGTAFTIAIAEQLGKPDLTVDLYETSDTEPIEQWIRQNSVRTLNVAGPRASKCPDIYEHAAELLRRLLA
ncbi:MAG: putative molybdenum carrier protein [Candidatus Hydrogenedentes bacterium]|nr:putative molybdenum carrier protein [Candidatus Hydrogenedentota bacterium]